jgi:hypothetical protein
MTTRRPFDLVARCLAPFFRDFGSGNPRQMRPHLSPSGDDRDESFDLAGPF